MCVCILHHCNARLISKHTRKCARFLHCLPVPGILDPLVPHPFGLPDAKGFFSH